MIAGYLTTKQLARRWGVSRQRIQRLAALGRLPVTYVGRQAVYRAEGIDQYRPRRSSGGES